jgi:SsrA-binding protein
MYRALTITLIRTNYTNENRADTGVCPYNLKFTVYNLLFLATCNIHICPLIDYPLYNIAIFSYIDLLLVIIMKIYARNKAAFHNYFIIDKFESGIELKGMEVKSIRNGQVNLKESYIRIFAGEAYIYNMHISSYKHSTIIKLDPKRKRKLLLHKREIMKLWSKSNLSGLTIIPLNIYGNDKGKIKIEIAVCKGKKLYDKREAIKKRDLEREVK